MADNSIVSRMPSLGEGLPQKPYDRQSRAPVRLRDGKAWSKQKRVPDDQLHARSAIKRFIAVGLTSLAGLLHVLQRIQRGNHRSYEDVGDLTAAVQARFIEVHDFGHYKALGSGLKHSTSRRLSLHEGGVYG